MSKENKKQFINGALTYGEGPKGKPLASPSKWISYNISPFIIKENVYWRIYY